jgi:tRNA A-37 threonylcarbamoyl transferase component Bud32
LFKIKNNVQHLQGNKIYMIEEWRDKLSEFGLEDGCDWLDLKPGTPVSQSNRVNAYYVKLKDGSAVYFKTYSFHGQTFDYFMRASKCATEVSSYQTLAEIGIPTIEPLAFGEDRISGALKSCCIVTKSIEDTVTLEDFAFDTWLKMPAAEKKKAFEEIFIETAKYSQMAHEAGFFHYDLKWRNILVKKVDGKFTTVWIDCPRGRKMTFRETRGRMVDISCLARLALSYLSKSQRYRFLVEYLGEDSSRSDIRKIWQLVDDHLSRRPPSLVNFSEK